MNAATARKPGPVGAQDSLKITEIFRSLQGESVNVGLPTVFIRLTGCPLRCQYCDTAYALTGGQRMSITEILKKVRGLSTRHICVTGGEPLAQPGCFELLRQLCDVGYSVSLETSGAIDITAVDTRVQKVVDIKTPGSAEVQRNRWQNIDSLTAHDQVKFVICNREDFDWSVARIQEHGLSGRCGLLFSPSYTEVRAEELADWLLDSRLEARLQIQMHKLLWGEKPGV